MEEIWKPVVGYDGAYEVSSFGRIKSLARMIIRPKSSYFAKEKILSPHKDRRGYLYVFLCKNGLPKRHYIHRIVASVFINNQQNKPCVDHINTITTDNRVENLRWCTHLENSNNPITLNRVRINGHSLETTRKNMKTRKENRKYNAPKEVFQYTKEGAFVASYESISEARRKTGIDNISQAIIGKRSQAGGYRWYSKRIEPQD